MFALKNVFSAFMLIVPMNLRPRITDLLFKFLNFVYKNNYINSILYENNYNSLIL